MKEEPSFWDDYFKVLPWNVLALIPLVAFFFTLQKDGSVLWSLLIGPIAILSFYMLIKLIRHFAMKILFYANLIYWTIFVVGAIVAKSFGLSMTEVLELLYS